MSTFILDACVAIAMVIEENDTPSARALQEYVKNEIHDLIAPDSLPIEVAHALTRAERQGKLMVGGGHLAFKEFLATCPKLYPYFDYVDRAMELSSRFRIGVFDCLYVAFSEEQDCRVVTVDERFLELFPDHTVSLHSL